MKNISPFLFSFLFFLNKSFFPLAFYDGIMRQMSLNWKDILTLLCVLTGKYIKIIKLMLEK